MSTNLNTETHETSPKVGIKKFIRLRGLIGFFGLILLVSLTVYVFAESLVKIGIESSLEAAFGAEVNIASVELNYAPVKITVNSLQVTDSDSPHLNLFSFNSASAGIDFWQYLLGKTIVNTLTVNDLTFSNKRKQVGKVFKASEDTKSLDEESMLPTMDMSLPDVSTLLNDSNLLTIKASEKLTSSYKEEKEKLRTLKKGLPDKAKIAVYKQRIKAIGKMKVKTLDDFNKVKAKFDELKGEFKQDQLLVKSAKAQLAKSKHRLETDVNTLKDAPEQDWKQIENKYQLDNVSSDDFAHILFGEKARGYYQTAEKVFEKIAPFIDSSGEKSVDNEDIIEKNRSATGRFVYFKEENPLPPLLIKSAKLSVKVQPSDLISGDEKESKSQEKRFEININEFTLSHWYREKPTTVNINATLAEQGRIAADSEFYRKNTGEVDASGQWKVTELELTEVSLSKAKHLMLTLDRGLLSGEGEFTLSSGKGIGSTNNFVISKADYTGEANSKFANILLDTFKSLDELTLQLGINGNVSEPSFTIKSSLNKAVKGAFKKQINRKLASFKSQVNEGLNDKIKQSLKLNTADNKNLIDLEAFLTDTDNALDNLKNSDVVKQQKEKLKNKAADKLKDKLKGLFG